MRLSTVLIAGAMLAGAAPPAFTFRGVEFEPADQRLPLAQAFVARVAAPGTPLPVAVAAIERAEAQCRTAIGGTIACRASRMVAYSELDTGQFGDVTWTVRLVPAAGRVGSATVDRVASGG